MNNNISELKAILEKEKQLFEKLKHEINYLKTLGHKKDGEYELFNYLKEVNKLNIEVESFIRYYNSKNKILNDIVEREELKQSFKIIK